jgi:hypothetical protein
MMRFSAATLLAPTPDGVDEVEQGLRDALEALRICAKHLKKQGYDDWAKCQFEIADEIERRAFKAGYAPKAN